MHRQLDMAPRLGAAPVGPTAPRAGCRHTRRSGLAGGDDVSAHHVVHDAHEPLGSVRTDDERVAVGDLVIDKRRHEVIREGTRIDLTPLEFQILELLASEPGRAWSRNALLDRVWSTEYEGYQRNIDPHINRLRKKLETDPKNPRYVLTVRGVGYKLNEAP